MRNNKESRVKITYGKMETALHRLCGRVSLWLEFLPMKRMAFGAVVLLLLSLIPLLLLGRYNVMCIDDYDYGRQIHDTWMATGSLWQSVQTAWRQNMEFYQNWQGTYISCFLMGLCPMNFDYGIAWIVPVLMIGMFAVSTFVLGKHVLVKWLGSDSVGAVFVMCMLLFLFYQVIEAPFEGIYWYNGATHYILIQSVWFFTLTAISKSFHAQKKAGCVWWCLVSAVLAVIVGGGNLVTSLQAEIFMALMILYAIVANRKRILAVCIPFITGSVGFAFNVLAPGNTLRSSVDSDEGYSAVLSILLSFYHAAVFIIRWTNLFVILGWLLLLPVLWTLAKKSDKQFAHPVWATLLAYGVLSAMFTPTLFAVGMVGLSRVDSIIQMVYYLSLILLTFYWMGYFSHREKVCSGVYVVERAGEALGDFLEKTKGRMTAVFFLLLMVTWVFTADKNTYTSISAVRSLVNGEARTFYAEAMERHELYIDESVADVALAPYSARPALFDFQDLSADSGYWLNLAVARYYGKDSVRVDNSLGVEE